MKKTIRLFILSLPMAFILASCGFGAPSSATEAPQQAIQPTASLPQVVTIELTAQADTSTPFTEVGQIIKYTFNVKNTGGTSVPGPVTVTGATCPEVNTIGNLDASFDVGESLACTASYTITQADLDKGSVANVATATVNGINSSPVTTTVNVGQPKTLALTVTANPTTYNQASQIITFTYEIRNSGTGTLGPSQFTVSGGLLGSTPLNCGDAAATLAPNATLTCTSTYSVTTADISANTIAHQVTASGGGTGPSPAASATVSKSDAPPVSGTAKTHTVVEGEWLWQIARCYGVDPNKLAADNKDKIPVPSQIQPGVVLTINNPGGYSKYYGPPCIEVVSYTIQSGDTWNGIAQKYNADPVVLQLANANVSLTSVGSTVKLRIPTNSAGATTTQTKALILTVTASPSTYEQVGQVITFTYTIKNSGSGDLGPAQFTVNGGLLGSTPLNCGNATTTLAPNATVNCTSTYTITQADVDAASVKNQVTASGGGAGASQAASVTVNLKTPDTSTKLLELTIAANPTAYDQAGQIITFTYTVKNSGTASLGPAQFTVSGGLLGSTPLNCGDATAVLAPGATLTCTSTYTIAQGDLAVNSIVNQATASGGGANPSQPANVTITKQ